MPEVSEALLFSGAGALLFSGSGALLFSGAGLLFSGAAGAGAGVLAGGAALVFAGAGVVFAGGGVVFAGALVVAGGVWAAFVEVDDVPDLLEPPQPATTTATTIRTSASTVTGRRRSLDGVARDGDLRGVM